MALLHSLEICGIRSFDPEDKQAIHFGSPVTLLLGQNGCGKTTVIECIRFALTNELPGGSSQGQGFLNDPKLSGKGATKASIKIKFLDNHGDMITVCRLLTVTIKANGGLQFKNLNPSIRRRDKNDPQNVQDISGRCLDVNAYCSTALNVSNSIINNVLFCHQDNSLWPLDEPKKVKEKFDEIFDAVKYNKCVDNIRKIVKDKQAHLKVLQERLDHKKSIKDIVDRERARHEEKKENLGKVVERIDEKKTVLKPIEDRLKEILDLEDSLGALQRELTGKEAEKKGLVDQQTTIKKNISYIFEGSDEDLTLKINSFQSEEASETKSIKNLEIKRKEVDNDTTKINNNIQRKQVLIGQLKEEQKQFNNKIEDSKNAIEKLRVNLEVDDLQELSREDGVNELKKALKTKEENFVTLMKQRDNEEKSLQTQIDEVREKCASTKQIISSKNTQKLECQKKLRTITSKLEELDSSDSQLKIVENKIENLQKTLSKLKGSLNEEEKLHEIDELKEDIEKKEQFIEKLDREYRLLQQNFVTEQRLETENSSIVEKQSEINKIKSRHSNNFQKLYGDTLPERNFRKSVLEIQQRQDTKYKAATSKINKLEKDIHSKEATLTHQEKSLDKEQKNLALNKRKFSELCKGRPFKEVLDESYTRKEKLQKDKGQYSSAKIMYEAFITKFEQESPCCPVCQTDFANKKSNVNQIVSQLKGKINRIPSQLIQISSDLKKEEEFYNKLQQLKPVNDEIELLTTKKIPELQEQISKLKEEIEDRSMELAAETVNLESPQELVDICQKVIADVTLLDQYTLDINKANSIIADLQEAIVKVASNRSRQETEAEIDINKAELSNAKTRYDSLKKIVDQHRDRCQNLNKNIQTEIQKQIDIQRLVQEKPLLEIQNTEETEKMAVLSVEVEELKENLKTQEKQLRDANEERQTVVQTNRRSNEEHRKEIAASKNAMSEIERLLTSIQRYETNDNEGKLDKVVEELAELKMEAAKLEEAKNKILEDISNKKEALAKKESDFRALKDNVTLREKHKLEEKLNQEIANLKKNIGGYNYRQVYDEKQRISSEIDKLKREISSLTGQKEEIENQVKELERTLNNPQNKNAFNNYKKQYYELMVNKKAVEDLNTYAIVLERSVLKFHEERMVQINRTIRELWRGIYRGNDIDYIEIKTDENMTGGAGKRRNYNYKVVQVKNNVELEMRGRCSAGQKVLACLVIRMALADTFSTHCGILALDEPTTNLDRENIISLSDALSRIITDRERESNFQLLIITHDEEFLQSLTRNQSLDNYWKVSRNQNGFSKVENLLL
ncbi:unnamed protein product [Phaedon cochleariae]|uniref:DNA repair protein RAD50 n=1 Tax=Phaedon cochleariae TaxID=80249 RepID=A0A9N9X2G7_PHACE|nr:unnamed protein product [Phaedon cochleariae]